MSDNLSFDLIVNDDSERGLNKFAKNLEKAGKNGQQAGRHIADGMGRVKASEKEAESETDRLNAKFEKLKAKAAETNEKGMSPLGLGLLALGPAAVPIAASVIPAAIGLGAAFAGAGASVALFKGVFTATLSEVQEDAKNLDTMQDKIAELGDTAALAGARGDKAGKKSALDSQKVAIQQYQAALKNMDPDQKKAVIGYRTMTNVWQQFIDKNKPATFGILAQGYDLIKTGIGEAQPLFDAAAHAAGGFLNRVGDWAKGGGLKSLVTFLATQGTQTFAKVEVLVRNLVRGFAPLFQLAAGQGQGLLSWVTKLSVRFAAFGQGGGWQTFMNYTSAQGPGALAVITNLATSIGQLVTIVTPFAPISLAIAKGLTGIIAAVPPGVLTAVIGGFIAYSIAMKAYAAYTLLAAGVTKIQAAAQWALNSAILANPVTWVIVGIVALIAVIVLVATKTRFFQTIWSKAFAIMKIAAQATWRGIKATALGLFAALKLYVRTYLGIWKMVFEAARAVAVKVWSTVKTLGKGAATFIANAWRSAVGRIKALIQNIRTKAGEVMGSIRTLFSPKALYGAGQRLIIGLARGIASKASAPIKAIGSIMSNIRDHLPGSPIKKGPLKKWNNGKAGKKLIDLVTKGVLAGKAGLAKAIANVTTFKNPITKTGTNPGTAASHAVALVKTKIAKGKIRTHSSDLKKIGSGARRNDGKGSRGGSGKGSGGGSGDIVFNFNGVQFGTPEQISKAVIGALRQFKASGGTVPFGTFQGGSV